jgi:23S rRNA (cytosine1962-C5)-methyltransferase
MPKLILKPRRERSVLRRHPWIFSGAVAEVVGDPQPGETVVVVSSTDSWLARAAYSPHSQIRARVWTWDEKEIVDEAFLARRLEAALERRVSLRREAELTAYREVHAESDGLPGVVVDRYNEFRVVQFLTAGAERWRPAIVAALDGRGDCAGIYERSDVDVREKEGLAPRSGSLSGAEPPSEGVVIQESDLRFRADLRRGQKTGFYLDQRQNRALVRRWVSGGQVLNAFAYSGGFTVPALLAGAERVVSLDTSEAALGQAAENVRLNGLPLERCEWIAGDAFRELRRMRDRGRTFDVVILDPPRFAATASQASRAARGYKDINLLAFKLLRDGGLLITFSCSGGVGPELFEKIVAGAALDAGVEAQILSWLGQPEDHPVALNFPEGRYLKGLVCRVAGKFPPARSSPPG